MPSIRTRFFGTTEYAPEDVTVFPGGIPPFLDSTRFVVLSDPAKLPLVFLQSIDDEALCFITIPIGVLAPHYQIAAEQQDLSTVGWTADRPPTVDDLACLVILTIPEHGSSTANLLAPVLINTAMRIGVQAVRADTAYTHAHPLEKHFEGAAPAC